MNTLNVSLINEMTENVKDVKAKLSSKYHEFLNVFDQVQLNKLFFHYFYNHKIELINDSILFCCWVYQMFSVKLLKVKKYLNENSSKRFITSSQILYFSFILFTFKANKDLWFCMNYWKLNVIFKRNKYSLSLINKIIDKRMSCKHLTKLDIILTFNKVQMHFNNENYITFITALEAYKYKMLSFKLTNKLIFFQQYMNDVLWNFLNDFCQVYLNNILIYSKMRKKHKDHVKLVLNWLHEAELQMNIQKCKFNMKETIFLEIIVSELNLRMNLNKVTVIVSFYHHFIKNFLKLIKLFIQRTRKNISFV